MAHLPKKGDCIGCISSKADYLFTPGCVYQVERVDRKINHVYVYADTGDLEAIDFPHDTVHGKFENVA